MTEVWDLISWFVYGFVLGFFANPGWTLAKKIYFEAKLAKEQWRKP